MLTMLLSLYFSKVVLKGLKQLTYRGCKTWEVCENSVIISSPNYGTCSIDSLV